MQDLPQEVSEIIDYRREEVYGEIYSINLMKGLCPKTLKFCLTCIVQVMKDPMVMYAFDCNANSGSVHLRYTDIINSPFK